jgi:hypothetical protein
LSQPLFLPRYGKNAHPIAHACFHDLSADASAPADYNHALAI